MREGVAVDLSSHKHWSSLPFHRIFQSPAQLNTSADLSTNELEESWINAHLPKTEIAEIKELSERVFDDKEVATAWLRQPNLATDDKPPIELLGTSDGFERVKNLLLRIQYGVLA
jgi:putative toxin-antitoxin system antitoxin component (TIGR02293 family)